MSEVVEFIKSVFSLMTAFVWFMVSVKVFLILQEWKP